MERVSLLVSGNPDFPVRAARNNCFGVFFCTFWKPKSTPDPLAFLPRKDPKPPVAPHSQHHVPGDTVPCSQCSHLISFLFPTRPTYICLRQLEETNWEHWEHATNTALTSGNRLGTLLGTDREQVIFAPCPSAGIAIQSVRRRCVPYTVPSSGPEEYVRFGSCPAASTDPDACRYSRLGSR